MKVDFYLFQHEHICAIVSSNEGNKFIGNLECTYPDWRDLLREARTGFDSFPYYDRYRNNDVDFWDMYLNIREGEDERYSFIGSVCDGIYDFSSEQLDTDCCYFASLCSVLQLAEQFDFSDICDVEFWGNYFVLTSHDAVLACSKIKIPFEPNPEQKAFRELLRSKLNAVDPLNNDTLVAAYGCDDSQQYDIENALFYNLGTASFNRIASRGTSLYFYKIPQNEIDSSENGGYRYVYLFSRLPSNQTRYWWENELVCKWENIKLDRVNTVSTPFDYFSAIKRNKSLVNCSGKGIKTPLGLRIQLFVPKSARFKNTISIMKPMIDGIICAFHAPDKMDIAEIASKIPTVDTTLFSDENTCLGKHEYILYPYRGTVKWNPRDEWLHHVAIECVETEESFFSFSGKIFKYRCC